MATIQTQGIMFPLVLTNGKHTLEGHLDLIQASIKTILAWPIFTRFYEDDFGSRIEEALEDQNDDVLITLIKKFTIDSISKWEKRITLKKFIIERRSFENLYIELTYRVNDLNIEDTLNHNFYTN